eukprot:6207651-Pleurochrysis_carterae.AAC.9
MQFAKKITPSRARPACCMCHDPVTRLRWHCSSRVCVKDKNRMFPIIKPSKPATCLVALLRLLSLTLEMKRAHSMRTRDA